MNVHFVTTGPGFPYLYYLGVMSAVKAYGDVVRLWYTEEPKSVYFNALRTKVKIGKVEDIPTFPALAGRDPHFKRVAIFDYVMWNIIHTQGGIIMGLDSLTLRSHFDLLPPDKEMLAPINDPGVLFCGMHGVVVRQGSSLAKGIVEDSIKSLNDISKEMVWGDAGITPFNNHAKANLAQVTLVPFQMVCGRHPSLFEEGAVIPHDETRTIALYASSSGVNLDLDEAYMEKSQSPYAKLVRKILPPEERNVKTTESETFHAKVHPQVTLSCKDWLVKKVDTMNIHQVLTSDRLPYMYYLSIVSALKVHKHGSYNLWVLNPPDVVFDPYFAKIKDRVTVRQIKFDFLPQVGSYQDWCELPVFEGRDKHFIDVHLKDLLSWKILYEEGGMFMDLDTLSIRDCSHYYENCESMQLFSHGLPYLDMNFFNCAVMIARPDSLIGEMLYEKVKEVVLREAQFTWGDTGPSMLNEVIKEYIKEKLTPELSLTRECGIVDGHGFGRIDKWFSDEGYVWDKCRLLHTWASSELGGAEGKTIDEDFIYRSMSPYAILVKRLLLPSEWNPTWVKQPYHTVRAAMVFHLLGLSHLPTNKPESLSCAYTQKVLKLADMLMSLGHRVYFYGLEGSEVNCDEYIQVASRFLLEQSQGKRTDLDQFYNLDKREVHTEFSNNAIREINRRKSKTDFLLCMYGFGHKDVADGVQLPLTVEPGIGYTDTFSKYRVFESYTWMTYVYGKNSVRMGLEWENGNNYDAVIPNYFDPNDFEFSAEKDNYLLFVGRIIARKGIEEAMQVAAKVGIKLIVAGQRTGDNINLDRTGVEYVGYVGVEERKKLYKNAKALLVPTRYIPPFEGVHIEAALSGTPVITTDWGVFGETVLHGKTGYRCKTFEQYVFAVNNLHEIDPHDCYNYAMANFTMDRIKWMYQEYFDMLLDLMVTGEGEDGGWYTEHPDRSHYDAWERYYIEGGAKHE